MLPWVPEADRGQCCPRPCTAEEQAFLEASAEIQGCLAPLTAPCSDWVSVTAGPRSQGSVDMAISFSGNSQNKWEEHSTGARDYCMSSDADKKTQTSKKRSLEICFHINLQYNYIFVYFVSELFLQFFH